MTLLELLVVLAIIAITASVAGASFRSPTRSIELVAVSHDLASRLRSARAASISRSKPVGVTFNLRDRAYRSEAETREVRLPPDFLMTVETARDYIGEGGGTARLLFYPDGSSSGGKVRLERDGRISVIGVDWLTGAVRSERP